MSRFPMPRYPNGWAQVAYSEELPPGGVMPLQYFGRDLVLFRTESGAPQVLDAHCGHMGAHLGHGGRVEGDSIVCHFTPGNGTAAASARASRTRRRSRRGQR